jgi:hypothetical protein
MPSSPKSTTTRRTRNRLDPLEPPPANKCRRWLIILGGLMAVDPKSLTDKGDLRSLLANADRLGREDIALACLDRLAELGATDNTGDPVELDCWKGIIAAEEFATRKNGRTTRLARTRQKIARVGVVTTVADLAGSPVSQQGFDILKENGRLDLSFEAISLKYPTVFSAPVRHNALRSSAAQGT